MAKNMYQKREERKQNRLNNDEQGGFKKTVINWYPGHMAKTKRLITENLNLIDVIYEVVDARMPYSSKIKDLDVFINNKPKLMIMTKMDLCDRVETNKWIKFYETKGYKVLPVTLNDSFNKKDIVKATDELMAEYNQKRENKGMLQRKTRVLVVGIPNAGKSTLINRLVGKKAVVTGNKPGVTKELSWIRIDDNIELLDTPGILWPKIDEGVVAYNLASLTSIKEEILPMGDVIQYILETLEKYYPDKLLARDGVSEVNEDIVVTLDEIGKKRGCLIRGGEIDYDKVIGIIINDIKNGYINNITFDRYDEYE